MQMDPRIKQLSKNLIGYSTALKPGERIVIKASDSLSYPLVEALVNEAYSVGGVPFVRLQNSKISRALLRNANEAQLQFEEAQLLELVKTAQAYIGCYSDENSFEASDVPGDQQKMSSKISKPSLDWRVGKTKWCVLAAHPSSAMAQAAEMSGEEFEEFYWNVCLLDYAKMSRAMDPLVALMRRTDRVHIVGRGTDLSFSIKGIPAIKCDGKFNVPDGEVFTAPVKESVNGMIYFTAPTIYESKRFGGVSLIFKNGKLIEATCEQGDYKTLHEFLNCDEGARYVGEFAIGVNPYVVKPMLDILFDEKIAGSFHFTPGMCYDEAPNGNNSQIHWDMVCIQTPEYGGGEMYFDDVLVRKNGRFVLSELEGLNPENLK
jgi:aminopeptidase